MCVIKGLGPKVTGVLFFFFLAFAPETEEADIPAIATASNEINNNLFFIVITF